MNKKIVLIPYIVTIIFLGLMVVIGGSSTYDLYLKHGWSYEVTTLIEGVETIEIVNVSSKITSLGFLIWIIILLIIAIITKLRFNSYVESIFDS